MRPFLAAFAAALGLAAIAWLALSAEQTRAYQVFASPAARVGDPGYNLVGRDWYRPDRS